MKFSIIICTYNSADQLSKTLESILLQNYDDYEVIIIDNCSNDETLALIKKYKNKFNNNLRWVSESDSGIYDAMNKGIDLAWGQWFYFLGSGDCLYDESVISRINEVATKDNYGIIYGNILVERTKTPYDGEFNKEKLIQKNISHQAIFFNKEVFSKLGKFNVRYKTLADWEFNMRWMNDKNINVKYVNMTIASYKLGGASKSFFDKIFYNDFEKNVKKYFPQKYWDFYVKEKQKEILFVKNEKKWKLWKMRNNFLFFFLEPKKFWNKYFFRK